MMNSPLGVTLQVPSRAAHVDADVVGDPAFVELLEYCDAWREHDQAVEHLQESAGGPRERCADTIAELLRSGILEGRDQTRPDDEADRWRARGWGDAFAYHQAVCNLPRFDYANKRGHHEDLEMMRGFVAEETPPDNYKDYPDAEFVPLAEKPVVEQASIAEILLDQPAVLDPGRMDFATFSWLTYLAFGQTFTRRMQVTGAHVAKTSPSGGSRHPTEVYAVVHDVEDVDPGIYHYSVRRNGLETIERGPVSQWVREHVLCHPTRPGFTPAVVYIFSSIFARSMFRYREPFSYRVMSHDIGHVMQTMRYLARAVRRPSYTAYSFHDSVVAARLGLDGFDEAPMAYAIVG